MRLGARTNMYSGGGGETMAFENIGHEVTAEATSDASCSSYADAITLFEQQCGAGRACSR
jgi:hypothetical protein